jgi:hypothetical protein
MYVGVIRGDMPGPIWVGDLETVSQTNFTTEPVGQTTYLSRPSVTALTDYLGGLDANYDNTPYQGSGGVPAGIEGSSAVTFPLTLTGSNNTISVSITVVDAYHSYVIPAGVYPNMTSLLAAANTALAGSGVSATTDSATGTVFILVTTALGVGAYIKVNVVGTSTFNTPAHFADHQTFTMPTAATIIAAMLPVGGPLLVTAAAILTNLGAAPQAAGAVALIAPQFVETTEAIQSFQIGMMAGFLTPDYNPDPRLLPALANGPAITVVQNDGTSIFTAGLPIITAAAHNSPNTGDITITGVDLGNAEFFGATKVIVTGVSPGPGLPAPVITLNQKVIQATLTGGTQGVVSATSIVIPASLLTYTPGGSPFPAVPASAGVALGVAGSTVEVKFTTLANRNYGTAATLASQAGQLVTVTGLTNMTKAAVGGQLTFTNSANPTFNNGSFLITSYVSSSSVVILNPIAQLPDANSGSLIWAQAGAVPFTVT